MVQLPEWRRCGRNEATPGLAKFTARRGFRRGRRSSRPSGACRSSDRLKDRAGAASAFRPPAAGAASRAARGAWEPWSPLATISAIKAPARLAAHLLLDLVRLDSAPPPGKRGCGWSGARGARPARPIWSGSASRHRSRAGARSSPPPTVRFLVYVKEAILIGLRAWKSAPPSLTEKRERAGCSKPVVGLVGSRATIPVAGMALILGVGRVMSEARALADRIGAGDAPSPKGPRLTPR